MRLRILASLSLALLGSSQALADDGCPPGSFSVIPSPDLTEFSFSFDQFESTAGGGTGLITDTSVCSVEVPIDTSGFSVFNADTRFFAIASDGQSVEITDPSAPGIGVIRIEGPALDDFFIQQEFALSTIPGQTLVLVRALNVDAGANPDEVQGQLDAIDLARIGFTTQASVQGSIDQLATQQSALAAQLSGGADLLLGFLEPLRRPTELGAFAAAGSPMVGATGNVDVLEGFSLFGGAAGFSQSGGGVSSSGTLLAGGARYMYSLDESFNLFAEASVWGSPNLSAEFTRQYLNNGALVSGISRSSGSLYAASGRLGVAFEPDEANQFVLSGTFSRNWLNLSGATEASSAGNLFAATIAGRSVSSDLVKATAAWSSFITPEVDVTVSAAIGHVFANPNSVSANVAYVGPVTGSADGVTFLEYGARVGWNFTPNASLSGFAFATSGDKIGTQARFGGVFSVRF